MPFTLAIAGLRHGHIFSLISHAKAHPEVEIVAICEEDPATRETIERRGTVRITHTNIDQMLTEVTCDAVAIGDYYGKRGSVAIRALTAGKHVISDKPLCIHLEEWEQIRTLSAAKDLKVGCMFTMRDSAPFIGARDLLQNDAIGEIHAISFGGQHPLMLHSRARWYFEPGKHGGTINDIGCHAVDILPWLTGLEWTTINAARGWNAFAREYPHFQDAGQMMLTMNNGCGVLGDVSYFLPNSFGYTNLLYWRMTFFGRRGILETSAAAHHLQLMRDGEKEVRQISLPQGNPGGYLQSFVNDVMGRLSEGELSTYHVLKATYQTLKIQHAADQGLTNVDISAIPM